MKTPKLHQWMLDGFPPIDITDFFCLKNITEFLNAHAKKSREHTEMCEALKEFSIQLNKLKTNHLMLIILEYPEFASVIDKMKSLLKEIENES